jgi:hypothetical protein
MIPWQGSLQTLDFIKAHNWLGHKTKRESTAEKKLLTLIHNNLQAKMNNLFLEALIVMGYHLALAGYWRTRSTILVK